MPAISVVIPSYNRAHCIVAAIRSVLEQTCSDIEIIVVDDGSRDATRQAVRSITDPRLHYLAHSVNRGGNAARNTGIYAAQGDYIAFLDSDDRWAPQTLERHLLGLRRLGPAYGASYAWMVCVDQHGNETGRINHEVEGDWRERILVSNFIGSFSAFMVRRDLLLQVGGLHEGLRSCQDWDLFIRLSRLTGLRCVSEHLVEYSRPVSAGGNRISSNAGAVVQGHRHILEAYAHDYRALPKAQRSAAMNVFFNAFAAAGAVDDAARTGLSVLRHDPGPRQCLQLARGMARAVKRATLRRVAHA